jgi:hypothetical protein
VSSEGDAGNSDVDAALSLLLGALDQAGFAPATLFKDFDHKQRYESLLTFARRRLSAALYHRERMDAAVAEEAEAMAARAAAGASGLEAKAESPLLTAASASLTSFGTHEAAIYELGALLGAIRSGIDFLATAGIMHLKGHDGDSISRMLSWRSQGLSAPTLNAIDPHAEWLRELRDYRDHLVHKLAITAPSGFGVAIKGGSTATALVPLIIPSITPRYLPDTRYARMVYAGERPFGIVEKSAQAWITNSDGSESILIHEHSYEAAPGYELVTALANRHLGEFRRFFVDFCHVLAQTGFTAELPIKQA